MSVCPVCQYHHQEEVSKCQRCNWSMQDSLNISLDHPILKICIPTLVNRLKEETELKNNLLSLIQTLDPDSQKANNQKLDEILDKLENENLNKLLDRLETERGKYIQEIRDFKTQVLEELKTERSNINFATSTNSNLAQEDIPTSSLRENSSVYFDSRTMSNMELDRDNSESDRDENNVFNMNNDYYEDSLYSQSSDRSFSESIEPKVEPELETTSSNNYQGLYRLISNGELDVTKVTVPQDIMEKIRGGTLSELQFTEDRKGNYWIVNWQDVYCLIPKENIKINQYQYGNFQRIFDSHNYYENYSDFEIIKPAIVSRCNDDTWQLNTKGEIKFK